MSEKPHAPKTDVVDVEPEKKKATCAPPALYPHRLRALKKLNNYSEVYELFIFQRNKKMNHQGMMMCRTNLMFLRQMLLMLS